MSLQKVDMADCDRDMPGVPPNPLPFWVSFPLLNKLPVPSLMPRGALFMHTCRMGEAVGYDFDAAFQLVNSSARLIITIMFKE